MRSRLARRALASTDSVGIFTQPQVVLHKRGAPAAFAILAHQRRQCSGGLEIPQEYADWLVVTPIMELKKNTTIYHNGKLWKVVARNTIQKGQHAAKAHLTAQGIEPSNFGTTIEAQAMKYLEVDLKRKRVMYSHVDAATGKLVFDVVEHSTGLGGGRFNVTDEKIELSPEDLATVMNKERSVLQWLTDEMVLMAAVFGPRVVSVTYPGTHAYRIAKVQAEGDKWRLAIEENPKASIMLMQSKVKQPIVGKMVNLKIPSGEFIALLE